MTELDEALMALEKDLREEERQQLAESKRHAVDGDEETMQAFCNGKAFGLNTAAQRVAALLTTRQEVAPVELPHPLGERHAAIEKALKGQTLLLMSRDHFNDKKKPLAEIKFGMSTDLGVLFCLADTEAPMPVDTTTGQTSEARDGGVICIGSDSVVSHTHPEYGRGLFFTEDAIIDAAQLSTNVDELVTAGRLYQEAMDGTHSLQQRVFAAKRFDKALAAMRQEATR